jgi:hypothetical protein
MRPTETISMAEHPLVWQTLAALALAGALLAIPAPVAAESKKDLHALHPISPALQGLLLPPRSTGQTLRTAPPAKEKKSPPRLDPLRKQLKILPKHNIQVAWQEATFARRVMTTRLPLPDHPQKPLVFQNGQIRVVDGDTFTVGHERFRIRGYDAPETTEAGGFEATQRLDALLHEGPVLAIPYGTDTYSRTLVEVYVNNRDVADVMKEEGHDKLKR